MAKLVSETETAVVSEAERFAAFAAKLRAAGLDAPWTSPGPLIPPKATAVQARLISCSFRAVLRYRRRLWASIPSKRTIVPAVPPVRPFTDAMRRMAERVPSPAMNSRRRSCEPPRLSQGAYRDLG